MNLCLHRVPSDLKVVWDEMAGRDSSYPEISRIGMQSTKYDLRQRSDLYRRQKDKREYVENLRSVKKGKSGPNSEQKVCTDILPSSGQECATIQDGETGGLKPSQITQNLASSLHISKMENIRNLPKDLMEFENYCKENKLDTHGGLSKLYFTKRESFLDILNTIILCDLRKKTKNKLRKFNFLLNKHNLSLGKIQFYIRLMHRLLIYFNHINQRHSKTIRVRS